MKKLTQILFVLGAFVASTALVQAGSLTNSFDSGQDYVTDGILGQTLWDGVYLGYGDIPGGNIGGNGAGVTAVASETSPYPGFLNLQSSGGGWAGAENDGFFLYKVVKGDFDVTVESLPYDLLGGLVYDNRAYHFAGLQVRAYNPNNSGAGYSTTSTNNSTAENSLRIWRFQEGIDGQVRVSTNNADVQISYASNLNTNTAEGWPRYYRITRVGNDFTFYYRTNTAAAWVLATNQNLSFDGTLTRTDWDGVALQVGIAQAPFSADTRDAVFDDFTLTGTNVSFPALPPAPTGLVTSDVNSNTVHLAWNSNGGDGSIVVIRANGNVIAQPVNGFNYPADLDFKSTNTLLGASENRVVYVGTGTSIDVTGLGGSNNTYYAAVFSYAGTGSSTVYNTANPAFNTFQGPGHVSAVFFTLSPSTVPRGGVASATVTATYDSGDSYDVSADPATQWSSDHPEVAAVVGGILTAYTNGTANISVSYAGVPFSSPVSVVNPAVEDDFSVAHDYLAGGVADTKWGGFYSRIGDFPGRDPGGDGPVATSVADASLTTNSTLTISAASTTWEGGADDGIFLFRKVPGDFQAMVHVDLSSHGDYQFAGLMARGAETNGAALGGSEDYVINFFFDRFSVITSSRQTIDGTYQGPNDFNGTTDPPNNIIWLLLQRKDGTNFYCYNRSSLSDPWTLPANGVLVQPNLTNGVPVQVGLVQSMYTGNEGEVRFSNFFLDGDGISLGTPPVAPSDLSFSDISSTSVTVNWTPGPGSTGSVVVVRAGNPINVQPVEGVAYTGDPVFGAGSDLGSGNYVVYVGTGSSVTVTGLAAGINYYVAVYAFGGEPGSPIYSTGPGAIGIVVPGQPESLDLALPSTIPMGGIGRARLTVNYVGGFSQAPESGFALSSSDTNIVDAAPGTALVTGYTNGMATITAVWSGSGTNLTNTALAIVVPPTYTDDFSVSHDYKTAGVVGTIWDGVYASPGSIPGTTYTSDPLADISVADANMSSNNTLTVTHLNVGWEFAQNDGFFLWKTTPLDFQMAVHVRPNLLDTNGAVVTFNNNPGLLARPFTDGGSPFVGGTNESWVSWTRFDEFGIGTYARLTQDNGTQRSTQPSQGDGDYWLLMVRDNSTNFMFYQRAVATAPWRPAPNGTTYQVADFQNQTMQVGILACAFNSGNTATSELDSFMLDVAPPFLDIFLLGSDVLISWPDGPGTLQSTPSLNPVNWQNVGAATSTNSGFISVTLPMTDVTSYFRLAE